MIAMRRKQLSFGDGLIADEVSDLREPGMSHADAVPADEEIVYEAMGNFAATAVDAASRAGAWLAELWRDLTLSFDGLDPAIHLPVTAQRAAPSGRLKPREEDAMKRPSSISVIALGACVIASIGTATHAVEDDALLKDARSLFAPLPKDMATPQRSVTPALVELGRALFFDPRMSVDGTASCARCHQAALYGGDALAKSHGHHDKLNARNAPTVLNAALQFKQHWTGNREDVEDQATKALTGAASFGNPNFEAPMARLKAIAGYQPLFRAAFPGDENPVTAANWGLAIGAYERTLVSRSRFDDFLGGKVEALSATERAGLRTFIDTGCIACHNGVGVGGGDFRKFGVVEDYWKATASQEIDEGRAADTKKSEDKFLFKVPSLRNVAMTGPYFHDGSVGSLDAAVRIMARVQLGVAPSDREVHDIVAFLGSLTGPLPENYATVPVLPEEQ
jgi:cytochrome c peroxidase